MNDDTNSAHSHRLSIGGVLVALGIIYGDIGTSPLYVFKSIVGADTINERLVLGGLSCVFWTLALITTIKYVLVTLEADNRGEGGALALFALVRRKARWLLVPAIIGGAALLADGIISPPISVSSAIEGLRIINPQIPTVPIVLAILFGIFTFQQFGTKVVGRAFGPVMLAWFGMISVLGARQIAARPHVLAALNPWWAIDLLLNYPGGFWLLGAVFLCTTGADALYSDLGHCGKSNIRMSWVFVLTALLLNYAGQAAWLLSREGQKLDANPFYALMPEWFLPFGIGIATLAASVASQALISGSFTLVTEGMRLYLFPKVRVRYPSELKGQLYVPAMNRILFIGCCSVVLYFQESSNMEAAYGLAITVSMLMTTLLLSQYLVQRGYPALFTFSAIALFSFLEGSFLVANLSKFMHGGWVTLLTGGLLFLVMWVWNGGSMIKRRLTEYDEISPHLPLIRSVIDDTSIPKFATHLVYMTGASSPMRIEKKIAYSLFRKYPKRADVYWFLHVDVVDHPYTSEYRVTPLIEHHAFRIDFKLGFRVEPRINLLFRCAIGDMVGRNEVEVLSRYPSLRKSGVPGDFRFIVLQKHLSSDNMLPAYQRLLMRGYFFLKLFSLSEEQSFGLDTSSVVKETVPLVISAARDVSITRIEERDEEDEEEYPTNIALPSPSSS